MATTTEQIILSVDIQSNTTRLAEIQKGLNDNGAALRTLNESFKLNKISADELAVGQVRLRQEASNLKTEQQALTKANTDQTRALQAEAGSIEQLRAQLSLGTAAYNAMSKAERENTDEGQKLQAANKNLSDNLKVLEAAIGDTRRNVGNYGGAITDLLPQLVKLQEQQKAAAPDSAAYKEVTRQIGFVQKAAEEAGTKMGLSAEQTTAKLNTVAAAIRPATAELVKLEKEQANVAKGSEAYNHIGFKIDKLNKQIGQAPQALQKVEAASEGASKGLQSAISKGLAPFQGQIDKVTGTVAKFKSGTELLNTGLASLKGGGETGALGFRAIAAGIAATGIGLLLIAITSLIGYLTQTAEGGKILKQILAGVGAVVTTLSNAVFEAGKYLTKLFTDPKQVAQDFLEFLKGQVVNRLQAFGVLLDGIRNRDFKKIADSVIQFNLGIKDGTDKAIAYGESIRDVAINAKELEAQMQKLKKSRAELEIDEVKEKGRVEELIRLSKDRTLTSGERLNKLREAGRLETELSDKALAQTQAELKAIQERNKAKGLTRTSDEIQEERDKRKEYNATVAERNSTLATIKARQSRFILEERAEQKAAQKAATDAAQQHKEDVIRAKITEQERLLLATQEGSAAQLAVKQRLVQLTADLEAAAAKKTADEKALIQSKADVASQKLADEFFEKNAERERQKLEKAKAEQQREYAEAQKNLEDYLAKKQAQTDTDFAAGLIGENEHQRRLLAIEKAGLEAALVNAKDYAKEYGDIQKKLADNEIKERERVKKEKKKISDVEHEIIDNGLQAGLEASDLLIKALGEETTAGQVALGIKKTLALAEIGINLEKQLSANATAAAKISEEVPFPLGPALSTAYLVTADAVAIAAAAASSAKVLGFNRGGIVPGKGPGTIDSVPAMLAPGETVINAKSSQMYPELLSHLNALGGGINFSPGYTSPTQVRGQIDGGLMARQIGNGRTPTAAEIGREVGKNVPKSLGVHTIREADARYQKPRDMFSLH